MDDEFAKGGYRNVFRGGPAEGHTIVSTAQLPEYVRLAAYREGEWVRVLESPDPWPRECHYIRGGYRWNGDERIDTFFHREKTRG